MSAATQALHAGQPVLQAGAPLAEARAAVLLVHGRGGSAEDILGLAGALQEGAGDAAVAWLAPQAANSTWYPYPFTAPLARNEPWLSSALATLESLTAHVAAAGVPPERTLLLGFSQGACLTLEFTARHARRWGGVAAFAGGLIGPDDTPRDYAGSLAGTPVFIGVGDADHHIPVSRVQESGGILARLGATTDVRVYPGLGHTIVPDEVKAVRALLAGIVAA